LQLFLPHLHHVQFRTSIPHDAVKTLAWYRYLPHHHLSLILLSQTLIYTIPLPLGCLFPALCSVLSRLRAIDIIMCHGDFYVICPDNETSSALDKARIAWSAADIVENRPALSRWHPEYKPRFEEYIAAKQGLGARSRSRGRPPAKDADA